MGYKIVGYPVRIENQRYTRNAFYFNLCFVCDSWARTVQYEPVVKKLSEYFVSSNGTICNLVNKANLNSFSNGFQKMMEAESGFLSKDESKENVFKVLNKVLTDLNLSRITTIIEGETTIHLKVVSHLNDEPPPIYDHLVPLLNPKFIDIPRDAWDLTTQQVIWWTF